MAAPSHDERVYLSVIAWPDGVDSPYDVRRLLADAFPEPDDPSLAWDREALHNRVALQTPFVLGSVSREAGGRICATIRARGGDAFLASHRELAALGPTLKIRDLSLREGALDVAIWRGPEATIRTDSIVCLVRAHLSDSVVVRTPSRARLSQVHFIHHMPPSVRSEFVRDATTRKLQTSDKLDFHTADGSVFQIDGDKFGYQILGDMKGHSDKANMDRMFELLQHLADHAVADMYFPLWKPPPGYDRLRIPNARLNNDDPAFAFYSRWCALMYRHILNQ
jgi:hypothetical protein